MPSLNPYEDTLGHRKAKHLLRRACFSYSKNTLDLFATLTAEDAVHELSNEPILFWEHPYDPVVNSESGAPDGFWMHTENTTPQDFTVGHFRKKAIISAVTTLDENEVLLIAGKGHETTQTIGSQILPFSDIEVALNALI